MRFGIKSHYALLAMIDLAEHGKSAPVRLSQISLRQKLPVAYLEQLFNQLKRQGLVKSARGQNGGYTLAKPPQLTGILEILSAIDEPIQVKRCHTDQPIGCQGQEARCKVHHLWESLEYSIADYLRGKTLSDLLDTNDSLCSV